MAEVENNMNNTERIHHYGTGIEEEAPLRIDRALPAGWPRAGAIEFDRVQMRYRAGLPLVLRGVSMHVRAGERLGIVGRTGAGKSSIVGTLFRLIELSGGSIRIDGVDISTIGLHDLRSNLAIIPQDPTLFKGTIRSNLDPFGECSDAVLWDALREAYLVGRDGDHTDASARNSRISNKDDVDIDIDNKTNKNNIENNSDKTIEDSKDNSNDDNNTTTHHGATSPGPSALTLDTAVEEEGLNFSLGQRQLLALARALARSHARIVICDEATSSVDFATDRRVQRTLARLSARGKTLVCIAHRLPTILAYDRVCVMDAGEVAELASPLELFDQGGIFASMCAKAGIVREDIVLAAAAGARDQERNRASLDAAGEEAVAG